MKTNKIPHLVLGIKPSASDKEIMTAYKKLAKQVHPDKYNGSNIKYAEEQFNLIAEAKNTMLSDEYKHRTIFTNPNVINPNFNSHKIKNDRNPQATVLCNGTVLMSGGFHPSTMNINMLRQLQRNAQL